MGALLHQGALIHHQDLIGVAQGSEPMGDEQHRAAPVCLHQVAGHLLLGYPIEGAGGLIENQQPRLFEHHAGNGDPLALAATQASPPLAHRAAVASWHGLDELVGTGHLGRQADLLKGGIGARQLQVGQHRAV